VEAVALDEVGNSGLISCSILTSSPTVIAEIVLSERAIALQVVEQFNNVLADNRILHAYLTPTGSAPTAARQKADQPPIREEQKPSNKPRDLFDKAPSKSDDVEMSNEPSYEQSRDVANEDRQNREQRHAEPDVQDGRYGFADGQSRSGQREREVEKVSESRRFGQDRGKGDAIAPDDRRNDRGSYQRGNRDDDYRRDNRSSQYGNGFTLGPNRGGNGYGRMYSDSMARGPPRGGRDDRPRDRY
jgi:hypothetical protein